MSHQFVLDYKAKINDYFRYAIHFMVIFILIGILTQFLFDRAVEKRRDVLPYG